jgi:uncharacterized protein
MTASDVAADSVRVAKEFFAAMDQVNEQALIDRCAEDIEWTVPGQWEWAGTHRGHAGLKTLFKQAFETADITEMQRHEFVAQGDRVMVTGVATATVRATNKIFEDYFVFSMTIRNGKVWKIREYIDTLAVATAMETAPKLGP